MRMRNTMYVLLCRLDHTFSSRTHPHVFCLLLFYREQRISQRQIVQKDTSSVSSQAAILETLLFRQDPFSQRDLDDQLKELLRAVSRRKLQKAKSCRNVLLRSTLGKQRYERLQRLLVLPRPRHLPSSIPASIRELFLKQELKRAVRETPLSELEYVPWDDIMDHTEQLLHDYRAWCRTLPPDTTSCCFSACPLLRK